MRSIGFIASCVTALATLIGAELNLTKPHTSKQILPSSFQPPQVFQHANLVRTINLAKQYPRETINVVVENVDKDAQQEYYIPFELGLIARVGGLEVRDKNAPQDLFSDVELVEFDADSPTEYYRIRFPTALPPKEKITLTITWSVLAALKPVPASIEQTAKQYVQHTFSAYSPSAYKTLKQKTNLKLPTGDVPDYTILGSNAENKDDPTRQGTTFTYGPYAEVPAGAQATVSVRYEYTKPLIHATLLERDIEVSHWGGNLATEERYWLENRGATLKNHFSRVAYQQSQYYNPPSVAARELTFALPVGSLNPYFIDDIGNVSTSRFRSNFREANLELKPRYPLFGGWKYKFRVGWDASLKDYLRKLETGNGYVLKVPFLQGPTTDVEYDKVLLTIVLPEGAINVKYDTDAHILSSESTIHRSFMDTLGRTTLKLTAMNVMDEMRERQVVITYDYPFAAGFRKPIAIFASLMSVFGAIFVLSKLDLSIGRKKA